MRPAPPASGPSPGPEARPARRRSENQAFKGYHLVFGLLLQIFIQYNESHSVYGIKDFQVNDFQTGIQIPSDYL